MQVQYDQPVWNQKMMYYTAKTMAGATISEELFPGYALFKDLVNTDIPRPGGTTSRTKDGKGVAVTKCENNGTQDNRPYFAGIVTNVNRDFKGPGWVWVISNGDGVPVQVRGSSTTLDPSYLGGVTGQWELSVIDGTVAAPSNLQGVMDAIAHVCARPLEAKSPGSGTVTVICDVGTFGGVG